MVQRISLALRSAIYATGFFLTLIWLVPSLLGIRLTSTFVSESPSRALGIAPLLIGAAIALWCVVNFVARGSGTPAPFDAPRKLVIGGPYCYVRNPMYIGGFLFLAGLAVMFVEFSAALWTYAAGLVIAVNLFVFFYEEPTLRRKFDGDYEQYCRAVRRWMPRLHPWEHQSREAVTGR